MTIRLKQRMETKTTTKDQSRAGGWTIDERRKRHSHQLENHCCGCLEALILLHTRAHAHTRAHTHTANVKHNLLTRREKGQRQQACRDPFFLPFLRADVLTNTPAVPFCFFTADIVLIKWHMLWLRWGDGNRKHSNKERRETNGWHS